MHWPGRALRLPCFSLAPGSCPSPPPFPQCQAEQGSPRGQELGAPAVPGPHLVEKMAWCESGDIASFTFFSGSTSTQPPGLPSTQPLRARSPESRRPRVTQPPVRGSPASAWLHGRHVCFSGGESCRDPHTWVRPGGCPSLSSWVPLWWLWLTHVFS